VNSMTVSRYKCGTHRAYLEGCRCARCKEGHTERERNRLDKGVRMPAPQGKPRRNGPGDMERAVIEEFRIAGVTAGYDFQQAVRLARGCDTATDDYDKPLWGLFLRTAKQLAEVTDRLHKSKAKRSGRKRATVQRLTPVNT
jgi:hypothetical protein